MVCYIIHSKENSIDIVNDTSLCLLINDIHTYKSRETVTGHKRSEFDSVKFVCSFFIIMIDSRVKCNDL